MTDQTIRDANLACLERVFEKISTQRSQECDVEITDDLKFELPYGVNLKPIITSDAETWLQMNAMTWKMFSRIVMTITRVHEMLDPDQLIVEYVSDGEVAHTGKPYINRYIGTFRFRDGRICEWAEFHNPSITEEAMRKDEEKGAVA